jgi:hypothetical protein
MSSHTIAAPSLESHAPRAYHPVARMHECTGRNVYMQGNEQARVMQIGGWLLVVIGMLLPTIFIVAAPRWLILVLPLACVVLVLGLVLVSGRWPSGNDAANNK